MEAIKTPTTGKVAASSRMLLLALGGTATVMGVLALSLNRWLELGYEKSGASNRGYHNWMHVHAGLFRTCVTLNEFAPAGGYDYEHPRWRCYPTATAGSVEGYLNDDMHTDSLSDNVAWLAALSTAPEVTAAVWGGLFATILGGFATVVYAKEHCSKEAAPEQYRNWLRWYAVLGLKVASVSSLVCWSAFASFYTGYCAPETINSGPLLHQPRLGASFAFAIIQCLALMCMVGTLSCGNSTGDTAAAWSQGLLGGSPPPTGYQHPSNSPSGASQKGQYASDLPARGGAVPA